jgi:hypothetical protein
MFRICPRAGYVAGIPAAYPAGKKKTAFFYLNYGFV